MPPNAFEHGQWVDCTPEWLAEPGHSCGATVRRVKLAPCESCTDKDVHRQGHPIPVGHQHLMVGFLVYSPLRTMSGEPE